MRFTSLLLAGAALVGGGSAANATFTVYSTEAAFLAAVSAPGVDTYTGFNINGPTPSPITRTAGSYSYNASASTSSFFGAGTSTNPWLSTNTATDSVTFNGFGSNVRGIGGLFFGSDIQGLFKSGSVTLTAVDATGTSTETITGATTSSFRGFVSTGGLTSLTVTAVQGATFLWPTVDNLTLAQAPAVAAVPEPATWAMMIVGFGMMGFAMRRRGNVKTTIAYA